MKTNTIYEDRIILMGLYMPQRRIPILRISMVAIGATVGLDELSGNTMVAIYPNPANQFLTISSTQQLQKVELVSIARQVVISELTSGNEHQLDVSIISSGVYFVTVYGKDHSVIRKKIVVQH